MNNSENCVTFKNLTLGICCAKVGESLSACLVSVLSSKAIPGRISILSNREDSGVSSFYLEQLFCLARMHGVQVQFQVVAEHSLAQMRDKLVEECSTEVLWFLDDDVMVRGDCLHQYEEALLSLNAPENNKENFVGLAGMKWEVSNVRNYSDYQTTAIKLGDVKASSDFCQNFFYAGTEDNPLPKCVYPWDSLRLDTGNLLLTIDAVRNLGLKFDSLGLSPKTGGEDSIFAMRAYSAGGHIGFCPLTVAWHLEKPVVRFSESDTRLDMLKMAKELIDLQETINDNSSDAGVGETREYVSDYKTTSED